MRIISQGGHADLPYEEIAVCMASEDIIARHNDKEYLIARYSTIDKAQKAMEMLHNDYYDHVAEKTYHQCVYYIHPCFRFPKDEDVEV